MLLGLLGEKAAEGGALRADTADVGDDLLQDEGDLVVGTGVDGDGITELNEAVRRKGRLLTL